MVQAVVLLEEATMPQNRREDQDFGHQDASGLYTRTAGERLVDVS